MLNFGLERKEFIERHFEKNPLLLRGGVMSSEVTWAALGECVSHLDPSDSSQFKVFVSGEIPHILYARRYQDLDEMRYSVDVGKLSQLLIDGATLVVNRLDLKMGRIAEICQALSEFLSMKVVANGYVAFGGHGSFGKHWDTHDVFAIQLQGRKRWRVCRPTFVLPLVMQTSRNHKVECPDTPIFDGTLEAGDVLYIPRGWWHEAIPIEGEETFHIAAGVHTATRIDYLSWLASTVLSRSVQARPSMVRGQCSENDLLVFAKLVHAAILSTANIETFIRELDCLNNRSNALDFHHVISHVR